MMQQQIFTMYELLSFVLFNALIETCFNYKFYKACGS